MVYSNGYKTIEAMNNVPGKMKPYNESLFITILAGRRMISGNLPGFLFILCGLSNSIKNKKNKFTRWK